MRKNSSPLIQVEQHRLPCRETTTTTTNSDDNDNNNNGDDDDTIGRNKKLRVFISRFLCAYVVYSKLILLLSNVRKGDCHEHDEKCK